MLSRYRPGDRVNEDDSRDLASLLKRHSRAAEKIGPGIHHFEVMSADYDTKCFWAVRLDETMESFSYPPPHCRVESGRLKITDHRDIAFVRWIAAMLLRTNRPTSSARVPVQLNAEV
jgi:hypothetical protein